MCQVNGDVIQYSTAHINIYLRGISIIVLVLPYNNVCTVKYLNILSLTHLLYCTPSARLYHISTLCIFFVSAKTSKLF